MTICLPLFLAGGEGDRAFARFHPTITVDGCDLKCAARGTETYSAKPAASIVVSELAREHGLGPHRRPPPPERGRPAGRRAHGRAARDARRRGAGQARSAAGRTTPRRRRPRRSRRSRPPARAAPASRCASSTIAGEPVEVVALPPIFAQLREAGRPPDEALGRELLETVKIYNDVPPELEAAWTRGPSRRVRRGVRQGVADEPHRHLPHDRQVDRASTGATWRWATAPR